MAEEIPTGPATVEEFWARAGAVSAAGRARLATSFVIGDDAEGIARATFKEKFKERFTEEAFVTVRDPAVQSKGTNACVKI